MTCWCGLTSRLIGVRVGDVLTHQTNGHTGRVLAIDSRIGVEPMCRVDGWGWISYPPRESRWRFAEIRDPSVKHALDAILSRVRGEPAPSEEGEARRAVAALVP